MTLKLERHFHSNVAVEVVAQVIVVISLIGGLCCTCIDAGWEMCPAAEMTFHGHSR